MNALPFGKPGRFYKGNLHTHSTNSDGDHPVEEVIRRYRTNGYDFLAMSDHFIEMFNFPVTDTTSYRDENFTTLIAAELHVGKLLNDEYWHVLAVGLPLDFAEPREGETITEIAQRAADAGAFIGLVHPEWYGLQKEDTVQLPFAHAVEVYNHGSHVETDRGYGWAMLDTLLNEGKRLTGFATDDAHKLTYDMLGGWIHVKAENLDPNSILEALKQGDYYSSQGPQFEDVRIEADEVIVECTPADLIIVQGHGAKAEQEMGKGLTKARFPLKRFADSYFRVTIVDQTGRKAWTNPVWLDN